MPITCCICIDALITYMESNQQEIYAGMCGHIFHLNCLTTWLRERSTCPQCRSSLSMSNVHRLYFEMTYSENNEEVETLRTQIENLKLEMTCKERGLTLREQEVNKHLALIRNYRKVIIHLQSEAKLLANDRASILAVKNSLTERVKKTSLELMGVKEKLLQFEKLDLVLSSSMEEYNELLKNDTLMDMNALTILIGFLKRSHTSALQDATFKDKKIRELTARVSERDTIITDMHSRLRCLEKVIETYKSRVEEKKTLDVSSNSSSAIDSAGPSTASATVPQKRKLLDIEIIDLESPDESSSPPTTTTAPAVVEEEVIRSKRTFKVLSGRRCFRKNI